VNLHVNVNVLSVIVFVLAAACNRTQEEPKQHPAVIPAPPPPLTQAPATATPVSPGLVALPAERTDSIRIEGTAQAVKMRLVQPASTLPFITYVPADMVAESRKSAAGEDHYFYANFGGRRNNEAYLLMHIFPPGINTDSAAAVAKAFRESEKRKDYVVTMDLRQHGNRYYFIGEHYPAEYGDGFGPRSQAIQRAWQWLDPTSAPRPE